MYYRYDNGYSPIICPIDDVKTLLESESSDYTEGSNERDKPEWNITLVWLTQEEFENLPEA